VLPEEIEALQGREREGNGEGMWTDMRGNRKYVERDEEKDKKEYEYSDE
jgi:hypothetical protein